MEYDLQFDYYSMLLSEDQDATHRKICYCPWCGHKFHEMPDEAWSTILREEYGITDPIVHDRDKVPPEFWTDEWWRKRGL